MASSYNNIRPNLAGDYPQIDSSALIDPSAQIIGNVKIERDVFVGPMAVIRADQRGTLVNNVSKRPLSIKVKEAEMAMERLSIEKHKNRFRKTLRRNLHIPGFLILPQPLYV